MTDLTPMKVPIFLNAPLVKESDDKPLVELRLRRNSKLELVENDRFDSTVIKYDQNYQNSVILSPTFQEYLDDVVDTIGRRFPKTTNVIEVGCGKGDFFARLESKGFNNLRGYDETYEGDNEKVEKRYLTERDQVSAELLILRHTLEHIARPHGFLAMLKGINLQGGTIFIEVPDFDWILRNNAFYDVAYEHVNYFTLEALAKLFDGKVLEKGALFDDQYIYVMASLRDLSQTYGAEYENVDNWSFLKFHDLFPEFTRTIRDIEAKLEMRRYAYVWGAAGKGGTFCHHLKELSPAIMQKLRFAVDINPKKVGKYLPSSLVRIASRDEFFSCASVNDLLIVTNSNYLKEISGDLIENGLREMEIFAL